jgi:hypothetical protein
MRKPYFTIHSIKALENRAFSVFRANIENTPDKLEVAKKLYPIEFWYIEFHDVKISVRPVYGA